MLYVGAARVDVHLMTWAQIDIDGIGYTRQKTDVAVAVGMATDLRQALDAAPREHVTILNTAFGKPFTINGFSGFMRDAMRAAGLPMDCRLMVSGRPLVGGSPMLVSPPTTSWRRSATRPWRRPRTTPGKLIAGVADAVPSCS